MYHVPPAFSLQSLAWQSLQAARGEEIEFHVTTSFRIEIERAVITQPNAVQVTAEDAIVMESRSWHWLVDPKDIMRDGQLLLPSKGQWIVRKATGAKYRIQPSSTSDLCWRWSEGGHTWLRIFCEEQGQS